MQFKVGQWVRFWTKNWPPDALVFQIKVGESGSTDVTGQGEYSGRGKIISVRPNGYLVCEERNQERLVELDTVDRIEPMEKMKDKPFTLGDLRRLINNHKDAPDDVPVMMSLPVAFNCDEEGDFRLPDGHPELHEYSSFHLVPALNVMFVAEDANSSTSADGNVHPEDRQPGEDWCFRIEVFPMNDEAHEALRDCQVD